MTGGTHLALVRSILIIKLRKQSSFAFLIVNSETIIDIVAKSAFERNRMKGSKKCATQKTLV
jgi:hypothetical protein